MSAERRQRCNAVLFSALMVLSVVAMGASIAPATVAAQNGPEDPDVSFQSVVIEIGENEDANITAQLIGEDTDQIDYIWFQLQRSEGTPIGGHTSDFAILPNGSTFEAGDLDEDLDIDDLLELEEGDTLDDFHTNADGFPGGQTENIEFIEFRVYSATEGSNDEILLNEVFPADEETLQEGDDLVGDIDVTISTIQEDAIADDVETLEFNVTLKDGSDPVEGVTVTTTDNGTDLTYDGDDSLETDSAGNVTISVTSTTAQTVEFTFEEQDSGNTATATGTFRNELSTSEGTAESAAGDFDTPIVVDDGITVSGYRFEEARVSIGSGFDADHDTLDIDGDHSDTFTDEYNASAGILTITPTDTDATADEFQAVFRDVTFTNDRSHPDLDARNITFELTVSAAATPDARYNPETGRYYEFVEDEGITWGDARDAAEATGGYLATIRSQAENDFIRDNLQAEGWIGASDADEEGVWRWVTGPEGEMDGGKGLHFFDQTAAHVAWTDPYPAPPKGVPGGGEAVDDEFNNWHPRHEPDNKFPFRGGQDYAYFLSNGLWQDASPDSPNFEATGYIVEYGETPSVAPEEVLTASRSVTYVPAEEPPDPPTATIQTNGTEIDQGDTVEFDASGSEADSEASIVEYEWDLTEDGLIDETGELVRHTFDDAGTHLVELTVTDDHGGSDTATVEIEVRNINPPTAVISGPNEAQRGETIQFDGTNSTDDVGIESFEWDFGDGSENKTDVSPTHGYDETGTYTVTLTVTDIAGNANSTTHTITIEESEKPDVSDFTVSNPDGQDLNVSFRVDVELDEIVVEVYDTDQLTPSPDDSDAYLFSIVKNGEGDFDRHDHGDGNFTYYNVTAEVDPGNYTARLTTAIDGGGEDGGFGQEDAVEIPAPITPEFQGATVTDADPDQVRVSFSGPIDATNESGFSIDSPADLAIDGFAGTVDDTVILSLDRSVVDGETITLSYDASGGTVVSAADGSEATGFTGEPVTNDVGPLTPGFASAVVTDANPDQLRVTFSADVEVATDEPGEAGFSFDAEPDVIDFVEIDGGDTVVLWLDDNVTADLDLSGAVTYDAGTGNIVAQADGSAAGGFSDEDVINDVEIGSATELLAEAVVETALADGEDEISIRVTATDRIGQLVPGTDVEPGSPAFDGIDAENFEWTISTPARTGEPGTVYFNATSTDTGTVDLNFIVNPSSNNVTVTFEDPSAPDCSEVSFVQVGETYLVETLDQLQCIGDEENGPGLDADYRLDDDIDASETEYWNDGDGFDPIGDGSSPFIGTFDGDGHTIVGLSIERPGESGVGLFGRTDGSTLSNVSLDNVDITGGSSTGGLVGLNDGTVTASSTSGGVVGGGNTGGLVGNNRATISASYSTATVGTHSTQTNDVGGLVGSNRNGGSIAESYATGDVSISGNGWTVGGLVGFNQDGSISSSVASGAVSGSNAGGLVGRNDDTVSTSYWDTETSELENGFGQGSGDATGLSTAEMQGASALYIMDGLGFEETFEPIESSYPELQSNRETTLSVATIDAAESSVSATSPHVRNGTDASTVTVHLNDSAGDPVMGLEPTDFGVSLNGSATIHDDIAESDDPGVYIFTVNNTVAETVSVSVDADGAALDDEAEIEFVYGSVNASTSSVDAVPDTGILADGTDTSEIRVQPRDVDGNTIEDLGAGDFAIDAGDATNTTVTPVGGGVYTFDLTHTVGETVTVNVTADGVEIDQAPTVSFDAPAHVDVEITDTNAPVTEGETLTVNVTATNEGDLDTSVAINLTDTGFDDLERDSVTVDLAGGEVNDTITLEWATQVGDNATGFVSVASPHDSATETVEITERGIFHLAIQETSSPVHHGDTLYVNVTVHNIAADEDTQDVSLLVDGTPVVTEEVTVGGNVYETVSFEWETDASDVGDHDIQVQTQAATDHWSPFTVQVFGDGFNVSHIDGTEPDRLPHLDIFESAGLLQVQLKNPGETGLAADELAGIGADDTTRFQIEIETDYEDPQTLIGAGKNTTWSVDEGSSSNVSIETTAVPVQYNDSNPDMFEWPDGDADRATIGYEAHVGLAIWNLSDVDDGDQPLLDGMILGTDAQVFSFPEYVEKPDAAPVLQLWVAAPGITVDDEQNTGFYEAFLPDPLLDDWGVTQAEELSVAFQGDNEEFTAEDVPGGMRISLDLTYSAGYVSISQSDPAEFDVTIEETNVPVTEGDDLDVTVEIENIGERTGEQTIELEDFDGTVVDDETISLAPDENATITLTWSTAAGDAGSDDIRVTSENHSVTEAVTINTPLSGDVIDAVSGETLDGVTVEVSGIGTTETSEGAFEIGVETDATYTVSVTTTVDGVEITNTTTVTVDGATEQDLELWPELDGEGTESNPFVISNAYELQAVSQNLGAHYVLDGDVDASDTQNWNGGDGFEPIGDEEDQFAGTFDGAGHTISDLVIDQSDSGNTPVGLFGSVGENGEIRSVALVNASVTGDEDETDSPGDRTGALVGHLEGTVTNSSAEADVVGGNRIGGLVGDNGGHILDSWADGTTEGTDGVGGLVGHNTGTVETSYARGDVAGDLVVGGLIGQNSGTIAQTYATGSVSSALDALNSPSAWQSSGSASHDVTTTAQFDEGIDFTWDDSSLGQSEWEYRTTAEATTTLEMDWDARGCASWFRSDVELYLVVDGPSGVTTTKIADTGGCSWSRSGEETFDVHEGYEFGIDVHNYHWDGTSRKDGRFSASFDVGTNGLVGSNNGTVIDSYWDAEATGQDASAGLDTDSRLNTIESQGASARYNTAGLDFDSAFVPIESAYPELATNRQTDLDVATISATQSTVEATSPHASNGTDVSTVTVAVNDSAGDPVTGIESTDFDVSIDGSATVNDDITESDDPGVYTFTVTNTETETISVSIEVDGTQLDDAPTITFYTITLDAVASATSYLIDVDSEVTFRADDSTVVPDDSITYEWDLFDNGTVDATGVNVSHSFDEPGTHNVTVTVQTPHGSDTDTITIRVEDRTAPTARIDVPDAVDVGEVFTADGSKSSDNVGIKEYEWDFGDGSTANEPAPSHTFDEPGRYTVSLTITDTSGNTDTNRTTVLVEGAKASLSTKTIDVEEVALNSSGTAFVAITNNGTIDLELTSIVIGGDDSDDFSLVGSATDGSMTIRPGETRRITVQFSPEEAGAKSAKLAMVSTDPVPDIDLVGSGVETNLAPTDPAVDFGNVSVGDTETREVTVENAGTVPITITDLEIRDDDAFAIVTPADPGQTLDPGERLAVTVEFAPEERGETSARLIASSDADTASVALTGDGQGPAIHLPEDDLVFTPIGAGDRTVTSVEISNYGSDPLEIDDVAVRGADPEQFRVDSNVKSIEPGETGEFELWFEPDERGERAASVEIQSNDPAQPTAIVTVAGEAVGAEIGIDRRTVDFGNVTAGETVLTNITVRNKADVAANLSITDTNIVGSHPENFSVVSGNAPIELEPGEERDITVEFEPLDAGTKHAQLQIVSDASNEPLINVWLSNSRTYIIVQEVSNPTVNVDGENMATGGSHRVNVWTPSVADLPAGFDDLDFTAARDGGFELDLAYGEEPFDPTFDETDDAVPLTYIEMDHIETVSEDTFANTSVILRVDRDELPDGTAPEEVALHRWNESDGAWVDLRNNATLTEETGDRFVFEIDTPGYSQFVVTAPPEPDPANFSLTLIDGPDDVTAGDSTTVTVRVTNTGDLHGTQLLELRDFDDNVVDSTSISLDPQDDETVALSWDTGSGDVGSGPLTVVSENDTVVTDTIAVSSPPVTLDSISLALDDSSVPDGRSTTFVVEASYSDGSVEDVTDEVSIWVSDGAVANVSNDRIEGTSAGTTTIRASYSGESDQVSFTVTPAAVVEGGVSASLDDETIPEGATTTVTVIAELTNGSAVDVTGDATITVENEAVVNVTDHLIRALAEGETTLEMSYEGESDQVAISVTPAEVVDGGVSVTLDDDVVPAGATTGVTVNAEFTNGSIHDVTAQATLNSSDDAIATIDDAGKITAGPIGNVTIRATYAGETGTAELTVTDAELREDGLTVTIAEPSPAAGETTTVTVTGTYTDGTTHDLTGEAVLTSSNVTVATVADNGTIVTIEPGSATIEASIGSESATSTLTVTDPRIVAIHVEAAHSTLPAGVNTTVAVAAELSDGSIVDVTDDADLSVDDPTIVTVDPDGHVSSHMPGSVTVAATVADVDGAIGIDVTRPVPVDGGLHVSLDDPNVPEGTDTTVTVTVELTDGSFLDVTDNATITPTPADRVSITSDGVVIAEGTGPVTIGVAYDGMTEHVNMTATEAIVAGVTLDVGTGSIPAGTSTDVAILATLTNGTLIDVTDSAEIHSQDSSVVDFDEHGRLTGIAEGLTAVDATYLGVGGTADLTVTAPVAIDLDVSIPDDELRTGDETQLTVIATYSDGATADITADATFSPEEAGIVSVAPNGAVTADAPGSATLAVTFADLTESINLHVAAIDESATIGVEPGMLTFGEVPVGETVTRSVTVTNLVHAEDALQVDSTVIVGQHPGEFEIVGGDAPFTLDPGETREIEVAFTPVEAGIKHAQLRILSDAPGAPQIDVWLANTGAYVVVQEVDAADGPDGVAVNVNASDLEAGAALAINVSQPGTRGIDASFDGLSMRVPDGGSFELDIVHSPEPLTGGTSFDASDQSVLQYVTIVHGDEVADPTLMFDETSIEFRVDRDALDADDPADIALYRHDGEEWIDMEATLVEETGTAYRFVADTPGFSQFVITVATSEEPDEDCSLLGFEFGSFLVCWYWWVLLAVVVTLLAGAYTVRRRRGTEWEA